MKRNIEKKSNNLTQKYKFRIYVTGEAEKSVLAYNNLKRICRNNLTGTYHIEVIDLLENPVLAKADQIYAIPTVIRYLPKPERKIIGDLSNTKKVLEGLEIRADL